MGDRKHGQKGRNSTASNTYLLLAYVADLELEVDRLRKQGQFIHHEARDAVIRIQSLCEQMEEAGGSAPQIAEVDEEAKALAAVLHDLQETPGYHPAHDQVLAIAVRPLAEQVFRSQQRLLDGFGVALRLDLETDHVEWFPARLRHILDNLMSNALKYRDTSKDEQWVAVRLRTKPGEYEFRVSDNGLGLSEAQRAELFQIFYRAAPARAAGLGVGLAVAKMLVEQSGGSLSADSGEGQGSTFVAVLPRYDLDDYLV
jgi:signal transduction histidine kinase